MDAADIGTAYAEAELQASIERRVRYVGESATECSECGETIAEARRVALPGISVCFECAAAAERG